MMNLFNIRFKKQKPTLRQAFYGDAKLFIKSEIPYFFSSIVGTASGSDLLIPSSILGALGLALYNSKASVSSWDPLLKFWNSK